ncbi:MULTISPECIES: MFS transporter [unclassified Streptomyces]|uniref:MFS transporter n=1 Tax=unclassified Streptomyces TaxID=2593676 RepID=UPI000DAC7444|nr:MULTISPECIES: MFS transporter [unclassified Streptomyces]PZT71780.1 MFS transporter [Streptomyces sp. AC1-42T]PZT73095.1 MFS transporter [Streptomyces sp. AC1-42W]
MTSIETARPTASASPTVQMSGRQTAALVVLLASQFMMAADFSVLNVALPEVGVSLGFSTGSLQWITTMFALCAAGCTLVLGRVGDFVGRRRIFTIGMIVLAVSSLLGGVADTPTMLLVARTLQGLATAAVTPAALALLTTAFTEPGLRTRALGLNSVMMSAGFSVGAILGGVLTDVLSWRWAFFINIPVAIAAVIVVPLVVDESRAERRSRIDLPGAVLITLGMFAGIYGVTRIGENGLDAVAGACLVVAAVLLGVFWTVESRTADALVPVRILKKPDIAFGNLAALFIFGGETALIFFTGLYVQNVLGLSSLLAGLVLLGIGVGQIIAGVVGPRILHKVSPRSLLGVSLFLQGAFMLFGAWASDDPAWLVPLIVTQFVNAFFSMLAALCFMVIATSSADADSQGMATGMATQSQQVGIAIGIPLISAVFAAVIGSGTPTVARELSGIHTAIAVTGTAQAVTGLLLWLVLRRPHS